MLQRDRGRRKRKQESEKHSDTKNSNNINIYDVCNCFGLSMDHQQPDQGRMCNAFATDDCPRQCQ